MAVVPFLEPDPPDPLAPAPPALDLLATLPAAEAPPGTMCSGVTATLIGVACVLNTGTEQSWMDRVSGISMPLPMQIRRRRLPPEHGASSVLENEGCIWKEEGV